jgi:hypothetical protein
MTLASVIKERDEPRLAEAVRKVWKMTDRRLLWGTQFILLMCEFW